MEYNRLCKMICSVKEKEMEIHPCDKMASDLGLCSFELMVLIVQIEGECNCEIDVSLLNYDMTVQELLDVMKIMGEKKDNG